MGLDAEGELLKGCRRGDPAAWDELFERHYGAVARFVYQLGSDFTREDAEEICQEVFLAVIKNINSFDGRSRFQTWLFRVATNKAQDFREKQQAVKRGGGKTPLPLDVQDPETGLTLDPPSGAPGPDLLLEQVEQLGLVHKALEKLGPSCREVIELRYFGDLSYEEIAIALRLNVKTVSSRLSKCLDRLEQIGRSVFQGANTEPFPSNN